MMRRAYATLSIGERVLSHTDATHYRRWIELRKCSCVEVGFKVDPSWENVRETFLATKRHAASGASG
ncbi:hypothetical protein [Sorangium sp. So ce887]|uniref:hypothetical protein n=1 Tax=Sorangium sp. So ce887 TaxID=3133324 RepID=UPI003F634304